MSVKFKYLEKVLIKADNSEYSEVNDKQGVIIGLPDSNDNDKNYTIYFTMTDDNCWTVPEQYLISTGEFEKEENIYEKDE